MALAKAGGLPRTSERRKAKDKEDGAVGGCDYGNLPTVCGAIRELPWHNIWLSDNPVEVLNEHLSLLVGRYVPTKVIRVHKDKPWFDDQCRHAFGLKQEAHLRWTRDRSRVNWDEFVRYQV